jgi:ADP-ribose pyrophosphatase YjhB (NUDIX family)
MNKRYARALLGFMVVAPVAPMIAMDTQAAGKKTKTAEVSPEVLQIKQYWHEQGIEAIPEYGARYGQVKVALPEGALDHVKCNAALESTLKYCQDENSTAVAAGKAYKFKSLLMRAQAPIEQIMLDHELAIGYRSGAYCVAQRQLDPSCEIPPLTRNSITAVITAGSSQDPLVCLVKTNDRPLSVVTGIGKEGEDVRDALLRETQEECGKDIRNAVMGAGNFTLRGSSESCNDWGSDKNTWGIAHIGDMPVAIAPEDTHEVVKGTWENLREFERKEFGTEKPRLFVLAALHTALVELQKTVVADKQYKFGPLTITCPEGLELPAKPQKKA